jgi:hypothetical protein
LASKCIDPNTKYPNSGREKPAGSAKTGFMLLKIKIKQRDKKISVIKSLPKWISEKALPNDKVKKIKRKNKKHKAILMLFRDLGCW